MSEEEDLDLLALQRQLDDAFETTRPRPAFEDELWLRLQSRRPLWRRFGEGLAGLFEGMMEAPAVPAAAVAIVLIVLVGAGIVANGLHPGGGASSVSSATKGGSGTFAPNAASEFGPLPVPALVPGASRTATSAVPPTARIADSASGAPNSIYFGPATLTWAGQLSVPAANLPVYRYQEPSRIAADQFAASLGAGSAGQPVPGALGTYSADDFTLVVTGSVAQPAQEPSFNLTETKPPSATPPRDPVGVATSYLAAHSLIPTWPYQAEVQKVGDTVRVRLLRSFDVPAQGRAGLVDGVGDRYGIEVDLVAGQPLVREMGPLPLSLDAVDYPVISAGQAIVSAVASSATSAGSTPYPVVRLTKAELVYTLVVAGDHSFYEPAFLFSGTFTDHGTTYVKRVLVPAVAPAYLSG
jgi:hypothetical protein